MRIWLGSVLGIRFMAFDYNMFSAMGVLYFLLGLASLITLSLKRRDDCRQLCLQINSWWRIFPVLTLALIFFPLGLIALGVFVSLLAVRELALYAGQSANRFRLLGTILSLFIIPYCYIYSNGLLFLAMVTCVLFTMFSLSQRKLLLLWTLLVTTILCMCILTVLTRIPFESSHARTWIFYLFVLTALNDIGQFVFGKLLGKRKIVPHISPNKTWGGLWGGVAVTVLVSLILGSWLTLAEPVTLIIIAIILALAGFFGDILFSAAKRFMGIKDFSDLIPGHGGILDRVDSLTLTAPVLYGLLFIFY